LEFKITQEDESSVGRYYGTLANMECPGLARFNIEDMNTRHFRPTKGLARERFVDVKV